MARKIKETKKKSTSATLKQIERAMLSLRLYPVAVNEEGKNAAAKKMISIYRKSSDSIRQHMLLLIHETIAKSIELRTLSTFDQYREKSQKASPGAIRMRVYKDMFNFNTSAEGLNEFIVLLGRLGGDDSAKLLTHLFSHFCCSEAELNRMLRNAVIDALGESASPYALKALIRYASLSDNDKILSRLTSALVGWDDKIEKLELDKKEKEKLKARLREILTREDLPGRQYG